MQISSLVKENKISVVKQQQVSKDSGKLLSPDGIVFPVATSNGNHMEQVVNEELATSNKVGARFVLLTTYVLGLMNSISLSAFLASFYLKSMRTRYEDIGGLLGDVFNECLFKNAILCSSLNHFHCCSIREKCKKEPEKYFDISLQHS